MSLNNLKNNFLKRNSNPGDIFSLMNELSDNNNSNTSNNYSNNSNNIGPSSHHQEEALTRKMAAPVPIINHNGPLNLKSENSYIDFVKSLGWDNPSGSNLNNIPHLDIYFMNKMSEKPTQGNFLAMEEKTKLFTPDLNYINRVNDPKNGYLWKAKVYDDFVGKSYQQMRHLLGNGNFMKALNQEESLTNVSHFLELEVEVKSKEQNHFDKLPETFDWRNVDGANYDSPIRKQGECGSCYAIAAVSVLEARIRIKSNNRLKPLLSPSSIISCSRLNQGCAGGYPYLVGKHGREQGFVEESCQPYSESDDKCYNYCFHQKVWKVKDYGYVGGYYGGCDEESMMRELYENGPIIVAINATPELYYYSNGIFHSEAKKTEGKCEKMVKPWEYTNHAVVLIGWGEENVNDNVVKFWILKNSWGDTWGEKGYFRMNRGSNMASVEAQGVYLSPDLD
jgi:cathepsin C